MAHTITLKGSHQRLLLELLAASYDYKATKKLRSQESIDKMGNYYIDAAEKIRDNNIPVHSSTKNLFTWLADQFRHSGTDIDNQSQKAQDLCRHASLNTYRQFCQQEIKARLQVNEKENI